MILVQYHRLLLDLCIGMDFRKLRCWFCLCWLTFMYGYDYKMNFFFNDRQLNVLMLFGTKSFTYLLTSLFAPRQPWPRITTPILFSRSWDGGSFYVVIYEVGLDRLVLNFSLHSGQLHAASLAQARRWLATRFILFIWKKDRTQYAFYSRCCFARMCHPRLVPGPGVKLRVTLLQ